MDQRFKISASLLNTWMSCSLQARFQYLDKLPRQQSAAATFGSAIHAALEKYNLGANINEAKEHFVDMWDNPENYNIRPDVWPKYTSYGSYRERGLLTLQNYHDALQWDGREVLAVEHEFKVPFGKDFILHGFVDLLERRKSQRGKDMVRVVDYKTSKKTPNFTALHSNIQFTVYTYAANQREFWCGYDDVAGMPSGDFYWEMLKDLPRRAIWYHLDNNKEIDAGPRDENDYKRLYRACVEIRNAIEREVFVPNISGDSCMLCSFTEPCGVKIPTAQDIEEDEERW